METLYWILEYTKVFLAYSALMFLWPSVVFRGYLKGKSRSVRFCFCVTVQPVLINTVVLGLGLLHILHGWLVALLFYGSFFGVLLYRFRVTDKLKQTLERLLTGTYGIRLFAADLGKELRARGNRRREAFLREMKGHLTEYIVLAVVLVFGMIYFTYGAFYDRSYGFGDMYTHHSWIYGLLEGEPFYKGIYPEAMHCFIYAVRVVFGVSIYSTQLFLAGIHVSVFLLSAWLFLRELSAWRGTATLALALFLTVDLVCIDEIFSMSRLQWTLPQEFGLYTEFLCALFLMRCLRADFTGKQKGFRAGLKLLFTDENLLLFLMSLAASLAIHFYATMMAFFLCLVIALCHIPSFFRKKRLLPLIAAVACGLFIAVAPMGLAFAEGIPFQGSIGWAVNIINGTDTNEGRANQAQQLIQTQTPEAAGESTGGNASGSAEGTAGNTSGSAEGTTGNTSGGAEGTTGNTSGGAEGTEGNTSGGAEDQQTADEKAGTPSVSERLRRFAGKTADRMERIGSGIRAKAKQVYDYGYVTLYKQERAQWILYFTVFGFVFWIVYRLAGSLVVLLSGGKIKRAGFLYAFDGHPMLVLMSALFMLIYAAPFLGLPELIAGSRLCSSEQLLIVAVVLLPVDIVMFFIGQTRAKKALPVLLVFGVGGIYAGTKGLGIYHGYLYNELTRYRSVVRVTNEIMERFPENAYTIVSPTDELYHVIEKGRHEELYDFVRKTTGENYTIPTEYIFLYVEKKPIQYAQSHFQTGPDWLAEEKYPQYYTSYFSEGEAINASEISEEAAAEELRSYAKPAQNYSKLESRTILESKAYQWFQKFSLLYPQETDVYYEDEDFVCYLIRQNPYRLFQLEVR